MTTRRIRPSTPLAARRRTSGGGGSAGGRKPARRRRSGGEGWRMRWFKRLVLGGFIVFAVLAVYFLWDMPDSDDVKPLEA